MLMRKLLAFFVLFNLLIVAIPLQTAAATNQPAPAQTFTAIDAPNISVNPVQGPPVSRQLASRAKSSWPWYITRAAGFVAAISLILLMLSGVGFITGASFKLLEPLTAWATHKAIAYVFGVSVAIHVIALLFDKYVPFTIAQAFVPFLSHYHELSVAGYHFGSLYVALGVIALYFVLAIILTSILWIDKKPQTWKLFHFLAYFTIIFVFFHALYLGTDLTHGVFRILWIIFGFAVAIAIVYRMRRSSHVK
jgi:sulfoxide reductase heme-binding subunit YedZ